MTGSDGRTRRTVELQSQALPLNLNNAGRNPLLSPTLPSQSDASVPKNARNAGYPPTFRVQLQVAGRTPFVKRLAAHLRPILNPSQTQRFIVLDRGLSWWQGLLEPSVETERSVSERRF